MAIRKTQTTLIGLVGAGVLAGSSLTGISATQAATGDCEDNIGYRISSPAKYRETGGNTVVIGLTAPARTVTFVVGAGSGCVLETGDHWSVKSGYFQAKGTYDGTPASLTDRVHVKVPHSSEAAGGRHVATVTLDDVTGTDNDASGTQMLILKRRIEWRHFNVFPESPTPVCGSTTMHAEGQRFRASWTAHKYRVYTNRAVRLLIHPGHTPFAPGHPADDTLDISVATTFTDRDTGWSRWTFKPPFDGTYIAHYSGHDNGAHADSKKQDFVHCTH